MDNKRRIAKLNEEEYQALFGVKKTIFEAMPEILEKEYQKEHEEVGNRLN